MDEFCKPKPETTPVEQLRLAQSDLCLGSLVPEKNDRQEFGKRLAEHAGENETGWMPRLHLDVSGSWRLGLSFNTANTFKPEPQGMVQERPRNGFLDGAMVYFQKRF